ncbi:MAG: YjfB family protein [Oscillospiraceae bacterium]
MEMSIASASMSMAEAKLQQSVSVSMMKKTMESAETSMSKILEMMDNMPSPDGRGTLLNVRV